MTTDFGFVNVKEESFPPLFLGIKQRKSLVNTIAQIMTAYEAKPAELLSTYTATPVMWELPSLFSEDLLNANLNVGFFSSSVKTPSHLDKTYKATLQAVGDYGFGPKALAILVKAFGSWIAHPMIFTRSGYVPEAQTIFGLEWACLLSSEAKHSIFQDNHAFTKATANFFTPPMGVIAGKCGDSPEVGSEYLEELKHRPRGFVEFPTFDALDRANIWIVQHATTLLEPEKMLRGLCLLKLTQNYKVAYEFEQTLHGLLPPVILDPTLKMLLYTDDALDSIRDIWTNQVGTQAEKLELLHSKLVPSYLDSQQYKDIFKIRAKPSERFSIKLENEVVAGMEGFIALFLQTRRAIADGKRILMEG